MMNMYKLPSYAILTTKTVFNNPDPNSDTDWMELVCEEQADKLRELGYANDYTVYPVHFFDSPFFDESVVFMSIGDAIQSLAIKDGADLVRFKNGKIGYVAYYNGNENAFEIIG